MGLRMRQKTQLPTTFERQWDNLAYSLIRQTQQYPCARGYRIALRPVHQDRNWRKRGQHFCIKAVVMKKTGNHLIDSAGRFIHDADQLVKKSNTVPSDDACCL